MSQNLKAFLLSVDGLLAVAGFGGSSELTVV